MRAMGIIADGLFFSDYSDLPVRVPQPPLRWEGFWGLVGDTASPTLIPLAAVPGTLPISDAFMVTWQNREYTGVPLSEYPYLVLVAFALKVVRLVSPPMMSLREWIAAAWTALHYRDRAVRVVASHIVVGDERVAFYEPPSHLPIADYAFPTVQIAGYDPLTGQWVFTDLTPAPQPGWGIVAPEGGVCFGPHRIPIFRRVVS